MTRLLPPMNAFRAFEAAARQESFLRAADELGVTKGAISRQVKILEEFLGCHLFVRHSSGVSLTEDGRIYAAIGRELVDRLSAATQQIRRVSDRRRLVISVWPSFGERWLAPRLSHFRELHPEINLEVLVAFEPRFLEGDATDLALTYSKGRHRGLLVESLCDDWLTPVCSPAFLKRHGPIREPRDLIGKSLLHHEMEREHWGDWDEWAHWTNAAGLQDDDFIIGTRFNFYSMVLRAAEDGMGIAVGHSLLIGDSLRKGSLVSPLELSTKAPCSLYLLTAPGRKESWPTRAFRTWMRGELTK